MFGPGLWLALYFAVYTALYSAKHYNFFKNNVFSFRCSSCVTSEWGCAWCTDTAACITSGEACQTLIRQADSCPAVTNITNTNLAVHVGKEQTFMLRARRLPEVRCYFFCITFSSSRLAGQGSEAKDLTSHYVDLPRSFYVLKFYLNNSVALLIAYRIVESSWRKKTSPSVFVENISTQAW